MLKLTEIRNFVTWSQNFIVFGMFFVKNANDKEVEKSEKKHKVHSKILQYFETYLTEMAMMWVGLLCFLKSDVTGRHTTSQMFLRDKQSST